MNLRSRYLLIGLFSTKLSLHFYKITNITNNSRRK